MVEVANGTSLNKEDKERIVKNHAEVVEELRKKIDTLAMEKHNLKIMNEQLREHLKSELKTNKMLRKRVDEFGRRIEQLTEEMEWKE